MKKELPVGMILLAVAIVVAIAGYFMYKAASTPDVSVPDPKRMADMYRKQQQGGGSTPTPAPAPPGATKPSR